MQTFTDIIRSIFLLTLIGALTYRFFLTIFFLHYHSQYLLHHQTIPAVIYLLVSYLILTLGLAYMYRAIYDVETKYETLGGKLVAVCYILVGILMLPVAYGGVLWVVGIKARVDKVFADLERLKYGQNYGVSEENMLRWYQISFYFQTFIFAFALIVIVFHFAYKTIKQIRSAQNEQIVLAKIANHSMR